MKNPYDKNVRKLLQAAQNLSGSLSNLGNSFAKVAFPLKRKIFSQPMLTSVQPMLTSVQPMTAPQGLVFFLDYIYDNKHRMSYVSYFLGYPHRYHDRSILEEFFEDVLKIPGSYEIQP